MIARSLPRFDGVFAPRFSDSVSFIGAFPRTILSGQGVRSAEKILQGPTRFLLFFSMLKLRDAPPFLKESPSVKCEDLFSFFSQISIDKYLIVCHNFPVGCPRLPYKLIKYGLPKQSVGAEERGLQRAGNMASFTRVDLKAKTQILGVRPHWSN